MKASTALIVLFFLASVVCSEETAELPVYKAFRTVGGIKVDGKLDEADWSAAPGVILLFPWESQTGAKQGTVVKILWDDSNLYIAYDCLDKEIAAVYDTRDDPTYKDDCVEVFISPNQQKLDLYYGLEMNCRAVLYDYFYVFNRSLIRKFNMSGVKLATDLHGTLNVAGDEDECWNLEVSIPFENFSDLTRDLPPKPESSWRINLNRWDGVEPHRRLSIWSPSGLESPNPHNPERFGVLVFSDQPVQTSEKEQSKMTSRYSVVKEMQEGMAVYVLKDSKSGCEAKIVPEFGNNCFVYRFNVDGEQIDVLDPPDSLATLKGRASGYGTPVLFPFPNRIREGKFSFEGKDYQFDTPRPGANSIHGLVINRSWKVEKSEASDEKGACLVSSIKSEDFPDIMRQYPFPFNLEMNYTLKDGVLSLVVKMENLGQRNMPVGFGTHPYFSAPISKSSSPQDCYIKLPARKYWELEEFLPTGRILDASQKYDLTGEVSVADVKFDDVFTDLIFTDGVSRCVIDDKRARMRMILESDSIFREMVLYTPPNRRALCFEPYTCPTDAINLHERGIDAGLIILKPGESVSGTIRTMLERY